ncbi:hypothetical protein HD554DRAFT_819413 [Boletus coccyginus]|nr:hypothetical protein HD554DRAFT_819413 [Boletus coccyginus]
MGSPTPLLIIRLSYQSNSEVKWHRRRPSMCRSARWWQGHKSVRRRRRRRRRRRTLGFQIGSCEQCYTSPRELASRLRLELMQACRVTVLVTSIASANPSNRLLPTSGSAKNTKKARTLGNIWTLPSFQADKKRINTTVLQGNKPYCMWS